MSTTPTNGNIDALNNERENLRKQWEFAAVVQFLATFGPALIKMDETATEVFEDAFLWQSSNFFLTNLHIQILRCVTDYRFINEENWVNYYKRVLSERFPHHNEFTEFEDFWQLSPRQKVVGLHCLCESLLDDPEGFRKKLKDPEEQEYWRVDPIGYDAQFNTYWLFDDNRLYVERAEESASSTLQTSTSSKEKVTDRRKSRRGLRSNPENPSDKEPEASVIKYDSDWQPVCITLEEWTEFPSRFEGSKNRYEKVLYKLLTEEIVPKVTADLKEKNREREKEIALMNRKRSNRLVTRELEQMEYQRQTELRKKEREELANQRRHDFSSRREEMAKRREEEERLSRLKEREERLRKREEQIARQKHEEELKKAKAESLENIKNRMNAKKNGKESWMFRCYCGIKGKNLDDGKPMLCCEKCETWFHIECVDAKIAKKKLSQKDWLKDDYTCSRCINAEKREKLQEQLKMLQQELKEERELHKKLDEIDVVGDDSDKEGKPKKMPKIKLVMSPNTQSKGITLPTMGNNPLSINSKPPPVLPPRPAMHGGPHYQQSPIMGINQQQALLGNPLNPFAFNTQFYPQQFMYPTSAGNNGPSRPTMMVPMRPMAPHNIHPAISTTMNSGKELIRPIISPTLQVIRPTVQVSPLLPGMNTTVMAPLPQMHQTIPSNNINTIQSPQFNKPSPMASLLNPASPARQLNNIVTNPPGQLPSPQVSEVLKSQPTVLSSQGHEHFSSNNHGNIGS